MTPEPQECRYCTSPGWAGNPKKFYSCGTRRNSLFTRRTDECRRREASLYVKGALSQILKADREAIKNVIRGMAAEVVQEDLKNQTPGV